MNASTYTSINNGNLNALAGNSLCTELVHLCHDMRRKRVNAIISPRGKETTRRLGAVLGNPFDFGLGHVEELDRVHSLDGRCIGQLGCLFVGLVDVVQLNRDALEQLIVELHSGRTILANRLFESSRILDGSY